jgi:DNA processing protein
LNTARYARELGRTLAAVPHNIDAPNGRGCNRLLRNEHAEPVLAPDDVLALLRMAATPTVGLALDGEVAICWHALTNGADSATAVARETGLPLRQVSSVLALLEIDGLVSFDAAGRVHPAVGVG